MKEKLLKKHKKYKTNFLKLNNIIHNKLKNIIIKFKTKCKKIIYTLLSYKNRRKNLTIIVLALVFNLLIFNFYVSYGYYNSVNSFSLLRAIIGDIKASKYDYVLLIYVEDIDSSGDGNGEYHLVNEIPIIGYNYSGYKCQNDSILMYDESSKVTSVTTTQKDVCSIYFDASENVDLAIKIMLEESMNSNKYYTNNVLPVFGYKFSYYECTNNGKLEYDSILHKVQLDSVKQDYCQIYFKKEATNIKVNLFVEDNYKAEDYINRNTIPINKIYNLNEKLSVCKVDSEKVNAIITYVDGYINIEADNNAICDIYLDKYE